MFPNGMPENGFAPPPGTYNYAGLQWNQQLMHQWQSLQMTQNMMNPMPQMGGGYVNPQAQWYGQNYPQNQPPAPAPQSEPAIAKATREQSPEDLSSELFPIKVQNRCLLQSDNKKYEVRMDEVSRRILGPEGMNATTLETYLRISKTAKDIENFREELRKINLQITKKKRKVASNTCFSAITEGEGFEFAKTYSTILRDSGLGNVIGPFLARTSNTEPFIFVQCKMFIEFLLRIFPHETIPPKNSPFYDFFCMTHGFGIDSLKAILMVTAEIFGSASTSYMQINSGYGMQAMTGNGFAHHIDDFNALLNGNNLSDNALPHLEYDVPARFTLPGMNETYPVPLDEIKRRLEQPENMNSSTLTLFLRRGKRKGGGKELREKLAEHNICLSSGKRKARPHTHFTALTESEAQKMAINFSSLLKEFFHGPTVAFRARLLESGAFDAQSLQSIGFVFSRLISILNADRSPLTSKPENRSLIHLTSDVQNALSQLSTLSHGFGVFAFKFALETIAKCAQMTD